MEVCFMSWYKVSCLQQIGLEDILDPFQLCYYESQIPSELIILIWIGGSLVMLTHRAMGNHSRNVWWINWNKKAVEEQALRKMLPLPFEPSLQHQHRQSANKVATLGQAQKEKYVRELCSQQQAKYSRCFSEGMTATKEGKENIEGLQKKTQHSIKTVQELYMLVIIRKRRRNLRDRENWSQSRLKNHWYILAIEHSIYIYLKTFHSLPYYNHL